MNWYVLCDIVIHHWVSELLLKFIAYRNSLDMSDFVPSILPSPFATIIIIIVLGAAGIAILRIENEMLATFREMWFLTGETICSEAQ